MNERIRELAEQCRIETYGVNGELLEFGFDEQKFAELIVGECSSICRNVGDAVWAEQHQSNIGTARTCDAAILLYFGVEE